MTLHFSIRGQQCEAALNDELIEIYRRSIELMYKLHSPSLDRERRKAHNKVSQPVFEILKTLLPDEEEYVLLEESRHIVTAFFDSAPTGRSTVGLLLGSDLLSY